MRLAEENTLSLMTKAKDELETAKHYPYYTWETFDKNEARILEIAKWWVEYSLPDSKRIWKLRNDYLEEREESLEMEKLEDMRTLMVYLCEQMGV